MYIVIEGQDATGKSTQVEMLANYLREQGKEVITMHEPDGDLKSTHVLRDLIKNKEYDLEPMTHVLLFTAARQELWRKLAEPVLKHGGYVISARNWWSTLAYQGYGQGVSRSRIIKVTKETMPDQYVNPDKAVIFTLDEKVRLKRQSSRDDNSKKDTFESKPKSFQEKVDAAYINIARDFIIPTIDATQKPEKIQLALRKIFGL